jgi:hypothetical protein
MCLIIITILFTIHQVIIQTKTILKKTYIWIGSDGYLIQKQAISCSLSSLSLSLSFWRKIPFFYATMFYLIMQSLIRVVNWSKVFTWVTLTNQRGRWGSISYQSVWRFEITRWDQWPLSSTPFLQLSYTVPVHFL